jgi:hypothetical protein
MSDILPKGHRNDKKHRGDKRRTYDVIPLDWGINNYDVYNRNGLIETVIFYAYIIFYLILKCKQ